MEYFTLNNGEKLPTIGYGCNTLGRSADDWQMEPDGDYRPLFMALVAGYRYYDTAMDYHNESALGLFLSESGLERDSLFISTKIPERPEYLASDESIRAYVELSLRKLRTPYLDMLLIHRPSPDIESILRAWRVMEKIVEEGKTRSIGVSNFEIPMLSKLMETAHIMPQVNQIMINPGLWHRELVEFCLANEIRPIAWSPLRNLTQANKRELSEIGKPHNKSWAQILLRFYMQNGIAAVPKSHFRDEIEQNIDIFDFSLTSGEVEQIRDMSGAKLEFHL